jgi:hypothetical protein
VAHDEIPDWVTGWNEYRRTRDEDAEERAYEAGFRRGRAAMKQDQREPVPGTVQWAVTQLLAGRAVRRKNGEILGPSANPMSLIGMFDGVLATDWELVETPDSPCDSP